jgi:hypothetical protein
VRRGVVQGDIFSPLCFIVALEAIFRRHDCKIGDGIRLPCKNAKNGYITVAQLAYADDTDLLCKDCEEASRRTTSISAGGRADADMHAHNKVKTEAMIHEQCVKIDTPTEEDIIAEKFEHACEYCASTARPSPRMLACACIRQDGAARPKLRPLRRSSRSRAS